MIKLRRGCCSLFLALVFACSCETTGDGAECDPEEVDSPCDTAGDTGAGALIEPTLRGYAYLEVDGGI